MLKTLLVGSAMLIALPALAQTTRTTGSGTTSSPIGTTTNDHDPTPTGDVGMQGTGASTVGTQVNGGTTMGSPGVRTGQTTQGSTTGTESDWGANGTTTSGSMTGSMSANGTSTTGAGAAYTGRGGPMESARAYPPCTRTRTDSCTQMRGRRR
jgi:hypothetical protein